MKLLLSGLIIETLLLSFVNAQSLPPTLEPTLSPIYESCSLPPNEYELDLLILVDTSCPIGTALCHRQQEEIAETIAAVRGTQTTTLNDGRVINTVRVTYMEYGSQTISMIVGASEDPINQNVVDPEQTRMDLYYRIRDEAGACHNMSQRTGSPQLYEGIVQGMEELDSRGSNSVELLRDQEILIYSNCAVDQQQRIEICQKFEAIAKKRGKVTQVNVFMVNNVYSQTTDDFIDPELYIMCAVGWDVNRVFVTNIEDDYYQVTMPGVQREVCVEHPTPAPTADPTEDPTFNEITSDPSPTPTELPTSNPTKYPTSAPTFEPLFIPTAVPTKLPTADPSFEPSLFPTSTPTFEPSLFPTSTPSIEPSFIPSLIPTISPTKFPTFAPSFNPSFIPTMNPTEFPTWTPTNDPISQPTDGPTTNPRHIPTNNPTEASTPEPTKERQSEDTDEEDDSNKNDCPDETNPDCNPTLEPTNEPTTEPTNEPTLEPTELEEIIYIIATESPPIDITVTEGGLDVPTTKTTETPWKPSTGFWIILGMLGCCCVGGFVFFILKENKRREDRAYEPAVAPDYTSSDSDSGTGNEELHQLRAVMAEDDLYDPV